MNNPANMYQYRYEDLYCFNNEDGSITRELNRNKSNNLMTLAINTMDKSLVEKILKYFNKLTYDQELALANYLTGSQIETTDKIVQHILSSLTRLILAHVPQDKQLKEILSEYRSNNDNIASIKESLSQEKYIDKINQDLHEAFSLYERNLKLTEELIKIRAINKTQEGINDEAEGEKL